ncbi:hypothetical protein [Microscilla marina]|uniref:Uncharacterized protein n=1 Tax=Microscilla marina ATCC 23134 TaxID=313606 RepID=A1ZE03_MICM2|nr:hypothetical protein [Microscilla marina]EAY31311.1 conserved hypothetical protein [Microscilla marina ATCC 23134]
MNEKTYETLTDFLLQHLQQRPGMYLKEPRLSTLSTFLMGYSVGRYVSQYPYEDDFFGHNGFIQWLGHYKDNPEVDFWEAILMEEAQHDEYRALELFFEYLEKFRSEQC